MSTTDRMEKNERPFQSGKLLAVGTHGQLEDRICLLIDIEVWEREISDSVKIFNQRQWKVAVAIDQKEGRESLGKGKYFILNM